MDAPLKRRWPSGSEIREKKLREAQLHQQGLKTPEEEEKERQRVQIAREMGEKKADRERQTRVKRERALIHQGEAPMRGENESCFSHRRPNLCVFGCKEEPEVCTNICPNWKTWDEVFARERGFKKELPMTWFDLKKRGKR